MPWDVKRPAGMGGIMQFEMTHLGCCSSESHIDVDTIEGDNIEDALKNYMKQCFSENDNCDIQVTIDGKLREFSISASLVWTYDIFENQPGSKGDG